MTALIIILCVLALFASLFFIRLRIEIKYDDGLYAVLRVLCFKLQLWPEKPPKQEMSVRELKKRRGKLLKGKRDRQQSEKLKKKSKKSKKKKSFSDIVSLVKEIKSILTAALEKTFNYMQIYIKELDVVVATSDPARTALTYGVVCPLLNQIIAQIEESGCKYRFGNMECRCDFLAKKFSCKAHIIMKIRVWQMLCVLIYSLINYFKSDLYNGGNKNEQQDK